jgi:ATP-dependent RNA helicase RhlE
LNFSSFNFHAQILESIEAMNFETPTPVQQQVIPEILAGKDVIACAQTGTGKTAAFLLPVLEKIITAAPGDHVKALIIVPTRELAIQIGEQAEGFGYFTNASSLAVYGGGDGQLYENEKSALRKGVDIVICTPGRMISHLNMGYVNFEKLEFLILDEADRMLDMGFHEDIMKIISHLPSKRQSLLFSATMPDKIRKLTKKILNNPTEISISLAKPPEKIKQSAFYVSENQKIPLVKHLIADDALKSIVVFCDTKIKVRELSRELQKTEKSIEEIHSDLEQKERTDVMNRFKNRQIRTLIATDIISRGIDVENIDMIINYDVPHDAEDYVHRIGRTARAESDGIAVTLICNRERRKFSFIENLIEKTIDKTPLPAHIEQIIPAPEKPRNTNRNTRPSYEKGRRPQHGSSAPNQGSKNKRFGRKKGGG